MKLFKLLTSCAIVHVVFAQAGLQESKLFNEELNSRSLIARGDGQWNSSLSTNTTTSSSMRTTSTNSTHVSSTSSTWPRTTSSSASWASRSSSSSQSSTSKTSASTGSKSTTSTTGTSASPKSTSTIASSTSSGTSTSSRSTSQSTWASSTTNPATTSSGTSVSTITTVPESFSTDLITKTGLSANSWLTTSKGGATSSTVVPVIWCPECGGAVVIWGLPSKTAVVWELPSLPSFEIPCIPLLSDCTSPPVAEEEGQPESKSEPTTSKSTSSTQASSSSSSSSTSSKSSSTGSCSAGTTTVTDCRVACSAFPSTSGGSTTITTMCYTTECEQTIGCSVVATTTTSVTTSEEDSCTWIPEEPYDAMATFQAAGIPLPGWMQFPITDDMLEEFTLNDDPEDDKNWTPEESDTSSSSSSWTSSSTSTSGAGHTEQTASSLDVPTGTASGSNSLPQSSCTYTTDTASSCTDGGGCKVKRTVVTLVTACNLEIPTLSFTPSSQNTGHIENSATALDVPTLSFTPASTTPLAPTRPTETPPSTADEPNKSRSFIQDTLTESTNTP